MYILFPDDITVAFAVALEPQYLANSGNDSFVPS